jgi:hypothetical protein
VATELEEALLATLLDELLDELLAFDELDDELEDEPEDSAPTEHHALVVKLFEGNSDWEHVKEPVSVAYTNEPDFPSATECVPLIEQVLPICAHFV